MKLVNSLSRLLTRDSLDFLLPLRVNAALALPLNEITLKMVCCVCDAAVGALAVLRVTRLSRGYASASPDEKTGERIGCFADARG